MNTATFNKCTFRYTNNAVSVKYFLSVVILLHYENFDISNIYAIGDSTVAVVESTFYQNIQVLGTAVTTKVSIPFFLTMYFTFVFD